MTQTPGERVALVTGSARGLGRAIAEPLGSQGVTLMLLDILADRLDETCQSLSEAGARCAPFATDISKRENCIAAVNAAIEKWGRLDILMASRRSDIPYRDLGGREQT